MNAYSLNSAYQKNMISFYIIAKVNRKMQTFRKKPKTQKLSKGTKLLKEPKL